jgi:hypothetical protein
MAQSVDERYPYQVNEPPGGFEEGGFAPEVFTVHGLFSQVSRLDEIVPGST